MPTQTLIGANMSVSGDIIFAEDARIDGALMGNIRVAEHEKATLFIGELARVEGQICSARLIIAGTIVGSIECAERLELRQSARIYGDVAYALIEMDSGAVVDGRLIHQSGVREDRAASVATGD